MDVCQEAITMDDLIEIIKKDDKIDIQLLDLFGIDQSLLNRKDDSLRTGSRLGLGRDS